MKAVRNEIIVESIVKAILKEMEPVNRTDSVKCGTYRIPTGVSNRHVHLSQMHQDILFGEGTAFKKLRNLSQPGQFVCEEVVALASSAGVIEKVRILGPVRKQSQVELLAGDCAKLGIKAPVRESGDLKGSGGGVALVGPVGCVWLNEGVIIAQRHIHMHTSDAAKYNVVDGKRVGVKMDSIRGGVYHETVIRVSDKFRLEFHVDFDEANAMSLKPGDLVTIIRDI